MRRVLALLGVSLMALVLVVGCAKQQSAQQPESSVDSLLASNPTEQSSGDITPQTEYQPTEKAPEPAAPTPKKESRPSAPKATSSRPASSPGVTVAAGTPIHLTVSAKITSETAQPGDRWTGVVKEPVIIGDRVAVPAGSTVNGVVSGVAPAQKGSRAFLVLAVQSVEVNGKTIPVLGAAQIIGATDVRISTDSDAELLLVDVLLSRGDGA